VIRPTSTTRAAGGFTLLELLITLVIAGIVTTLAVAGYGNYIRRAARADATAALLRLAAAQEKFYAQNGTYTDVLADAPPAGLGIAGTERGYYTLDIALAADATVGYAATATVDAGGNQRHDEECWVFGINERGLRSAAERGGAVDPAVTERCWR
jgi:type IV pilus assembly protein PilE